MKETDCRKCCVSDFKDALCKEDFCEKYYREGSAEDFEKLLPHWIPCSERLPEDGTIALVCGKKGGIRVARVFIPYATGNWDGNPNTNWWTIVGTGKPFFPVAWMPLPEPYREGEQDE